MTAPVGCSDLSTEQNVLLILKTLGDSEIGFTYFGAAAFEFGF
jgi:hypothetical protein